MSSGSEETLRKSFAIRTVRHRESSQLLRFGFVLAGEGVGNFIRCAIRHFDPFANNGEERSPVSRTSRKLCQDVDSIDMCRAKSSWKEMIAIICSQTACTSAWKSPSLEISSGSVAVKDVELAPAIILIELYRL